MAPQEVHRYLDGRGDTVVIKFDPDLIPPSALPSNSCTTSLITATRILRKPTTLPHTKSQPTTPSSATSTNLATSQSTEIPGPISMFHEWRHDLISRINWSSLLLDKESATERFRKDRKPPLGFVLWEGNIGETNVRARWVGFERNEIGCVVEKIGK